MRVNPALQAAHALFKTVCIVRRAETQNPGDRNTGAETTMRVRKMYLRFLRIGDKNLISTPTVKEVTRIKYVITPGEPSTVLYLNGE